MKTIIAAHDKNRVIGRDGDIPWIGELPADLERFKSLTLGNVVLMGRTTHESIGRPLPQRRNIVMTHNQDYSSPGAEIVHSLEQAYDIVEDDEDLFIIGGNQIYQLTMPDADRLELTIIDAEFDGDTYFPELSDNWNVVTQEQYTADDVNKYNYTFMTYERTN